MPESSGGSRESQRRAHDEDGDSCSSDQGRRHLPTIRSPPATTATSAERPTTTVAAAELFNPFASITITSMPYSLLALSVYLRRRRVIHFPGQSRFFTAEERGGAACELRV